MKCNNCNKEMELIEVENYLTWKEEVYKCDKCNCYKRVLIDKKEES